MDLIMFIDVKIVSVNQTQKKFNTRNKKWLKLKKKRRRKNVEEVILGSKCLLELNGKN